MTLEDLIQTFSEKYKSNPHQNLKNLIGILSSYNNNDYEKYIHFSEKSYSRVTIFKNENFEILLLCWKQNQLSNFHQHAKNGCLLKVLDGNISEDRVSVDKTSSVSHFKKGQTTYMSNDLGVHKIYNDSDNNTITLHVYSPPGFKE